MQVKFKSTELFQFDLKWRISIQWKESLLLSISMTVFEQMPEEKFLSGSSCLKTQRIEHFWFSPFCVTCGIRCSVSPPCAAGRSSARQSWRPERGKVLNLTCNRLVTYLPRPRADPSQPDAAGSLSQTGNVWQPVDILELSFFHWVSPS